MKAFNLIAALLVLLLAACNGNEDANRIEASGNIESTNITVTSQVSGEVLRINFDEGREVVKGDTILIIDPEIYQLKLEEALATLSAADARYQLLLKGARDEDLQQGKENLKQAEINLESAERDKNRFENLYESKSITKKQYEDALSRYEIALAQYNSAKQNLNKLKNLARPEELQQARANLDRIKANVKLLEKSLRDCFVTAPTNGIVTETFVEEGENVNPSSSLFKISDLSEVELEIYIPETELGKVKRGQDAEVSVDTYPDKIYKGTVSYISPEAEFTPKNIQTKEERTKLVFAVKIKIPNPGYELKSGMPADAVIMVDHSNSYKVDK